MCIRPMVLNWRLPKLSLRGLYPYYASKGSLVFWLHSYKYLSCGMVANSWNPSSFPFVIFPSYFPYDFLGLAWQLHGEIFREGWMIGRHARPCMNLLGTYRRVGMVVVWTSLGSLPRWVPGPATRWAPGTTQLALHGTWWRGAQGLRRRSTRLGSCTCPALYGRLLDVLDWYSLPTPTCNPASRTI
jgi:hypothetical protein